MAEGISREEHEEMKARFEDRMHRIEGRIDDAEESIKDLTKSMLSIQRIELKLEGLQEDQKRVIQRLNEIEREPADKWKKATWTVVTVLITAIVTYFFSKVGGI